MPIVACEIPQEVKDYIVSVPAPGVPESYDHMHLTLAYIPEMDTEAFFNAGKVCASLCRLFSPVRAGCAVRTSFSDHGDGYPVIVRIISPDLHRLRKVLCDSLEFYGVEYSKKYPEFNPHITLSYSSEEPENMEFHPIQWEFKTLLLWGGNDGGNIRSMRLDLGY